jgi:hypothetical protein
MNKNKICLLIISVIICLGPIVKKFAESFELLYIIYSLLLITLTIYLLKSSYNKENLKIIKTAKISYMLYALIVIILVAFQFSKIV